MHNRGISPCEICHDSNVSMRFILVQGPYKSMSAVQNVSDSSLQPWSTACGCIFHRTVPAIFLIFHCNLFWKSIGVNWTAFGYRGVAAIPWHDKNLLCKKGFLDIGELPLFPGMKTSVRFSTFTSFWQVCHLSQLACILMVSF